jgi:hypothetical protein
VVEWGGEGGDLVNFVNARVVVTREPGLGAGPPFCRWLPSIGVVVVNLGVDHLRLSEINYNVALFFLEKVLDLRQCTTTFSTHT